MPKRETTFIVGPNQEGLRLDKAAAPLAPEAGLSRRRRLIKACLVLVDGRPRPASYKVRIGQEVALANEARRTPRPSGPDAPRLIAASAGYVALYKPAGLHTASLPGGGESLEDMTAGLGLERVRLLTRLDFPTSGLVLAANSAEAETRFRAMEDEGRVRKTYLCLAEGEIAGQLELRFALDTAKRTKTRVLQSEGGPLRRTLVRPLLFEADRGATLAAATIRKGARHQIRAHLAAVGRPLVGDPLYGPETGAETSAETTAEASAMYLHHAHIAFDGFSACAAPPWREGGMLSPLALKTALAFLQSL